MNAMNHHKQFLTVWRIALPSIVAAALLPVAAADTVEPAAAPPSSPRSIFIQPTGSKEGRDPFFPLSMRPYTSAVPVAVNNRDLSSLVIVGKSGSLDRPLVIINNVTFAVGDEREVVTPQGRILIHCLQIVGDLAIVESGGQRHTIRFEVKP
jgi:hypothetical protein